MKRLFSFITALVLLFGLLPMSAAADEPQYLALGDSITTGLQADGTHLADNNFVSIVAENGGYAFTNAGVNTNYATGILAQFADGSLDEALAGADLITITIGGNDMKLLLYHMIAEAYTAMTGLSIDPEFGVQEGIIGDDPIVRMNLLLAAGTVLPGFAENPQFDPTLEAFLENFRLVLEHIHTVNPDADVIVCTQYNPYYRFTLPTSLILKEGFEAGILKLNQAILDHADEWDYLIADVYTAFANSEENLSNADETVMQLDFHPNAAGHAVIAECIQAVIDGLADETGAAVETEEVIADVPEATDPNGEPAYAFTLIL
ncbi:MAG: SGNH/GDSL hydrolase family protein [Clostridia bacterium]|nr:SGNH/GDSL hydrolase family protein [Clostridia bacterium]MBO5257593.1 SGNH/GDSL hydrolase family protein [Clostridia bacterium]